MKRLLKNAPVALIVAAGALAPVLAYAESYDSPTFAFGSHEAYLIQHCTYNVCAIDYTTMPNWPSNPIYGRPSIDVYENPYDQEQYDEEAYPPPEENPYDR